LNDNVDSRLLRLRLTETASQLFAYVKEGSNVETVTDVRNLSNPFIGVRLEFGMRLLLEMYLLGVSINSFNSTSTTRSKCIADRDANGDPFLFMYKST
jgi:hypothetical protein